jgi:hypothetical protein
METRQPGTQFPHAALDKRGFLCLSSPADIKTVPGANGPIGALVSSNWKKMEGNLGFTKAGILEMVERLDDPRGQIRWI